MTSDEYFNADHYSVFNISEVIQYIDIHHHHHLHLYLFRKQHK